MSRFRKNDRPRLKPWSNPGNRKLVSRSLISLLAALTMIVVSFTIFSAGPASAAAVVQVPPNPASVNDPCGPNNASWDLPADADTDQFDFGFDGDHLIVTYVQDDLTTFPNGSNVHDYGVAPESGAPCGVDTIDIPATPTANDPCGPNNATWNVPADSDTLEWSVDGDNHLVVSIIADDTEFTDGSMSHDYGVAPDSGQPCDNGDDTKAIAAKALDDHGCDSSEWHFVITQVDNEADAPESIHVMWANGNEANVSLDKFTGGVAHYTTTANLNSTVTSVSADIYSDWSGQFNLSHGPCEEVPPTKIDIPATPTANDPCGPNNATWNVPADTDTLHWAVSDAGHLVVSIVADDVTFSDGTLMHDYGVAPDSNQVCLPGDQTVTPVSPTATQPSCEDSTVTVTPSSQDGVIWDPSASTTLNPGDSVTYTASAAEGFVLAGDIQTSWSFSNTFDTDTCVILGPPPVVITEPVPGTSHNPVPTTLPDTGWMGSPTTGSPVALVLFAAGLGLLLLGSSGLCVAVTRRRKSGER